MTMILEYALLRKMKSIERIFGIVFFSYHVSEVEMSTLASVQPSQLDLRYADYIPCRG